MKPGFALIEILVAIALGALIMGSLFTSFFQINKSSKVADQAVEYDARAMLVQYQFEHDLSGVLVPYEFVSQKETTTEVKVTESVQDKNKTTETTKSQSTQKETVKKEEPLERSFYAEDEGGNLKLLTFITSNPLPSYDSKKARIARVTYALVPEKQKQGAAPSYRLVRDEQPVLKFAQSKTETPQGYELVRGIRGLKVEYRARPPSPVAKAMGDKQSSLSPKTTEDAMVVKPTEEKKLPPYEKFQVWGKDQIKKIKQNLPQFVDVVITFWDRAHKLDRAFEFKIALMVQDPVREAEKTTSQKDEKQGDEKKEGEKKTGETPAPTTQQPQAPERAAPQKIAARASHYPSHRQGMA
jgi:prepilin-type N-terminal cleavage/methylation domain-containing protein